MLTNSLRSSAPLRRASDRCGVARHFPVSRQRSAGSGCQASTSQQAPEGQAAAGAQRHTDQSRGHADSTLSRRALLFSSLAGLLLPRPAHSEELPPAPKSDESGGFLGASFPRLETPRLPKAYQKVVRDVITNLRDSINAEAEGGTEFEVRRKADPAKASVQEFVRQWSDNDRISADVTHQEIKGAIRELGQFYQKNGQRVSLTRPVREGVLAHLAAAEASLPVAEDKDKFLGLF